MELQEISRKLSDNRSRKFRRLYVYKNEIIHMRRLGFTLSEIKSTLWKKHHISVSVGALQGFIKDFKE